MIYTKLRIPWIKCRTLASTALKKKRNELLTSLPKAYANMFLQPKLFSSLNFEQIRHLYAHSLLIWQPSSTIRLVTSNSFTYKIGEIKAIQQSQSCLPKVLKSIADTRYVQPFHFEYIHNSLRFAIYTFTFTISVWIIESTQRWWW